MKWKIKLHLVLVCLLAISGSLFAQQMNITGVVSDKNDVLIGVSVKVKGTTRGAVTDMNGRYAISATQGDILVFTYLGYNPREMSVGDKNVINVVMEEKATDLSEVVVIGYGTSRKSDLTGSISSIKGDDLTTTPATSITEMLRGKAPGIQATLNSGRPGTGSTIRIRGIRSLTGSNDPLYIVDGIPLNGGINEINPQDIASVEVLKDAASQSIYGARAANGVIFITTKRGDSGKPVVEYNGYAGKQYLSRNFDFYNGEEWYQLRREAKRDPVTGNYPATPHEVLEDQVMEEVYASKQFVDWEDLMIHSAWLTKHDLSVRGGGDKLKAAASLSHYYQDGMVDPSDYKRSTFRMNIDWELCKFISFGANFSLTKGIQHQEDGYFNEFITRHPLAKPFDESGSPTVYIDNTNTPNPLYKQQESTHKITTDKMSLSAFMIVKPFQNFSYRLNASLDKYNKETGAYKTSKHPNGKNGDGTLSYSYQDHIVIENILNYDLKLKRIHDFNFTLIQSVDMDDVRSLGYSAQGAYFDDFGFDGLPNSSTINSISRDFTERNLVSFAARVRYNLMDKYLLNISVRRDGSSVFGANNKWGTFPSASFAWRVNEENFMKELKWISSLKLRLSYGLVGNQGITPYRTLGLISDYPMLFGNTLTIGYLPTTELRNPNLKWESTTSTNLGIDWSVFDQRITLIFDYYNTTTKDLIVNRALPKALGYSTMYDNLGETKTKGFDVGITGDIIRQSDLNLSVGLNFSKSQNEIVKIDDKVDENGKYIDNPGNNWYIGQSLRVYHDYEFDGIWQTGDDFSLMPDAKPGDIKVKDINGDGKITPDGGSNGYGDRRFYKRDPDWFGSFTTNLYYKGFDLYVELYRQKGGYMLNSYMYEYNNGGSLQGKLNGIKVNYWTPENPSNEAPQPRFNTEHNYRTTLGYQDASYFRFRTLTLGYTLPKSLLNKIGLNRVRLYVTATNLYTKTKLKSYSPELGPNSYPEPKQVIGGLNVSF